MTYPTEDDIEIVVAGLDRIEIKVTSDVKQGEALKKRILEALKEYNWNKQMNNVSIANHYFVTLKDKAERVIPVKPDYVQKLEAQVKELKAKIKHYEELADG